MRVGFWKYEAAGNDFVIVDARAWAAAERALLGAAVATRLCDRHFGIGADGVLRLDAPASAGVVHMTVLNADGSTAEMCGNGLRCVSRWVADEGVSRDDRVTISTGAGPLVCRRWGDEVEVELGAVTVEGELALMLAGEEVEGWRLRVGNPHFVVQAPAGRDEAVVLGAAAQDHPAFPGGVNVSCRRFTGPGEAALHVYERGCGLTLACGTGAGATTAAAWLAGDLPMGEPLRVHLPGGILTVSGSLEGLLVRGPARRVYRGEIELP